MEKTVKDARAYPLGYSGQEAKRLAEQAALVEQDTENVLRRAGIRQGMRVLEVGSGVGDVSLLLSQSVGADGAVVGIERACSSMEVASQRVTAFGVLNVSFRASDVAAFSTDSTFDALVGRAYVSDRADFEDTPWSPGSVIPGISRRGLDAARCVARP